MGEPQGEGVAADWAVACSTEVQGDMGVPAAEAMGMRVPSLHASLFFWPLESTHET